MFLEDKTVNPGVKVEVDPFSLEALIAWLEKQDPAEPYSNANAHLGCKGCVFARYAAHLGYPDGPEGYSSLLKDWGTWPDDPYWAVSVDYPFTLGGALQRARNLLSERNR